MMTLAKERSLWRKGVRNVVGVDEVGRGPLAGPVVAAAVLVPRGLSLSLPVRDSKSLTPAQREGVVRELEERPGVLWATGRVGQAVIDRINIYQATRIAMKRAVLNLALRFEGIEYLLVDGIVPVDADIPQTCFVKGDQRVFSCALASIVAKVTRDRMMGRYDDKYPEYGFARHKGYGTRLHKERIALHGPSPLHRLSFRLS